MAKVSFHTGKKWSYRHNTRDFDYEKWNLDGHISEDLKENNLAIIDHIKGYKKEYVEYCEKIFGSSIEEYNRKNQGKHQDRIIDKEKFYQKEIKGAIREAIIQVGSEADNPLSREEHKEWLCEVVKKWQQENPNLVVMGAFLHFDETTEHLHLDYLPVAHKTKGLGTYLSYEGAIKEQGFDGGRNYMESPVRRWLSTQRERLEQIASKYCEVEHSSPSAKRPHKDTWQYKEERAQREVKKAKADYKEVVRKTEELAEAINEGVKRGPLPSMEVKKSKTRHSKDIVFTVPEEDAEKAIETLVKQVGAVTAIQTTRKLEEIAKDPEKDKIIEDLTLKLSVLQNEKLALSRQRERREKDREIERDWEKDYIEMHKREYQEWKKQELENRERLELHGYNEK